MYVVGITTNHGKTRKDTTFAFHSSVIFNSSIVLSHHVNNDCRTIDSVQLSSISTYPTGNLAFNDDCPHQRLHGCFDFLLGHF